MAKLYFKFGAMGCGKTRDLIKTWHNYREKGMNAIVIKPGDDTKAGANIQSRANEELATNFVIPKDVNIYNLVSEYIINNNLDCVLVDEAQFLTAKQVDELTEVVDLLGIPVLSYGLRADAFGHLFPGSQRFFEVADAFEELKAICKCGSKATQNVRFQRFDGELIPIFEGPQLAIDGIDAEYDSMCRPCYKKLKREYGKK